MLFLTSLPSRDLLMKLFQQSGYVLRNNLNELNQKTVSWLWKPLFFIGELWSTLFFQQHFIFDDFPISCNPSLFFDSVF